MNRRIARWIRTGLLLSALSATMAMADDAETPGEVSRPQPLQPETTVESNVPPPPTTFTPTETIKADSSVPFPVDI